MREPKEHIERVRLVEASQSSPQAALNDRDWRDASWLRCISEYKLDPSRPKFVDVPARELRQQIEIFDQDIKSAHLELERALSIIQQGGYSAYIANRHGTIIAERRSRDASYYCSTDRLGAVWSEEVGGTNGIGTSIRTLQPTGVYLNDHFFADFTIQSCAAAPFFDPDGQLLGVVNFSTRNPALQESMQQVVFGLAQDVARRLEAHYFRHRFSNGFIVGLGTAETACMLAVDDDFRLIGATRAARQALSLPDSAIGLRSLWGLFEKPKDLPGSEGFFRKSSTLRHIGTSKAFEIHVQRPLNPSLAKQNARLAKDRGKEPTSRVWKTVEDCVGRDPRMEKDVAMLRRLMGSGLHILLLGETGVGKDTLARALHNESSLSGPFVAFNCSAMPDSLIDSELFGYSSGAFTGASKDGATGRIVEANGGTLFLDEIGDMPLTLQTRLLRFLESGEVTPLGGGKTRYVDVQVIAATNQDLDANVLNGKFRRDLFHRLAGAVVTIAPLRERSDVTHLVQSLLGQCFDGRRPLLTDDARKFLLSYSWPGNIRELRTVLQRASRIVEGDVIALADLTIGGAFMSRNETDERPAVQAQQTTSASIAQSEDGASTARSAMSSAEKTALEEAVKRSSGDALKCAWILGVSRATLYRMLKRHEVAL